MCGISGYLNLDSGVDCQVLRRMTQVIRHRGPDDEGYLLIGREAMAPRGGADTLAELGLPPLADGEGRGCFLGFGHRRLSILDLSAKGHQPMVLADRGLAVTYNGEIYNYVELREELEAMGYAFRTTCDTEVLLYAYCAWGEECLSHFNGMWGFALWDSRAGKLFCARDRLGAKPFHYWRQGNRMLFGSELKQLCQDDTVPRRFNRESLAASLVYSISDYDEKTWIAGFYNLQPGHKLVVTLSPDLREIISFENTAYWELKAGFRYDISADEWKEQLRTEFSRSCRWRMRSDAPLAALLSGGLDSSCMVAEMCGQMEDPSRLNTFTTRFPQEPKQQKWDESRYAEMLARRCGCRWNPVLIEPPQDIEGYYAKQVWTCEGNTPFGVIGSSVLYEQVRNRGFKVVLNGQCGDETMFGYEWYSARYVVDLMKKLRLGQAARLFGLLRQTSGKSTFRQLQELGYHTVPAIRTTRKTAQARTFVAEEVIRERHWETLKGILCPHSSLDLQIQGLTTLSLPRIIRLDDRQYMATSLESRIPFMDYRFVELAIQIPPELKVKDGYTKYIMREIFDGRMPDEVTWRGTKLGFAMPIDVWRKQFSRDYLQDHLRGARSAPYFQMQHLEQLARTAPDAPELFDFLNVELFARQFRVD